MDFNFQRIEPQSNFLREDNFQPTGKARTILAAEANRRYDPVPCGGQAEQYGHQKMPCFTLSNRNRRLSLRPVCISRISWGYLRLLMKTKLIYYDHWSTKRNKE